MPSLGGLCLDQYEASRSRREFVQVGWSILTRLPITHEEIPRYLFWSAKNQKEIAAQLKVPIEDVNEGFGDDVLMKLPWHYFAIAELDSLRERGIEYALKLQKSVFQIHPLI